MLASFSPACAPDPIPNEAVGCGGHRAQREGTNTAVQTQNAQPCTHDEEEDEAGRREKEERTEQSRAGQGRAGQGRKREWHFVNGGAHTVGYTPRQQM